jgi:hypothetical protein
MTSRRPSPASTPKYRDHAPARLGVVEGREQVRAKFARPFADVPGFRAELLSLAEDRDTRVAVVDP